MKRSATNKTDGSGARKKKATPKRAAQKTASKETSAKKTNAKRTVKKTSAKKPATKDALGKRPTARKTSAKAAAGRTGDATRGRKTTSRPAPARGRARSGTTLDRQALARIREQLLAERRNLEAEMSEVEAESFQGTQSELTGEVGVDEDFADAGSATFDREQALSIQNNIRDLMDQTDRALARIDDGSYGSCERCGRAIYAARINAIPRTLLSTDCKRREERAR